MKNIQSVVDRIAYIMRDADLPYELEEEDGFVVFKTSVYTPEFQTLVEEFGTNIWFSQSLGGLVAY